MSYNNKTSVMQNHEQLMHRLKDVASAYGADQSRWPVTDRLALQTLLASDRQANQLLDEAASIDRLLDLADQMDEPSVQTMGRLSQRIMERLELDADFQGKAGRDQSAVAGGIAFPGKRSAVVLSNYEEPDRVEPGYQKKKRRQGRRRRSADLSYWAPGAALAASLMIGVFTGASGYLEQATNSFTLLAGLDVSADRGLDASALIDDGWAALEEEFL